MVVLPDFCKIKKSQYASVIAINSSSGEIAENERKDGTTDAIREGKEKGGNHGK